VGPKSPEGLRGLLGTHNVFVLLPVDYLIVKKKTSIQPSSCQVAPWIIGSSENSDRWDVEVL
jgi:hypothetical protein